MNTARLQKSSIYPWISWFLVSCLYLMSYSLLVSPSIFSHDLQFAFSVDSAGIGALYSAFLYTYVLMQVPAGIFLDRYSCRRLLFFAAFLMAMGCLQLSYADSLVVAFVARMLMGLGGSFAFLGALYIGRSWFPVVMFPMVVGLTEAMSGLSEIGFIPFMGFMKSFQSWRTILFELGICIAILALLILFIVKDRHPERKKIYQKESIIRELYSIVTNPIMWLLCLFVGFVFSFQMLIANMWGIPMLVYFYHIPVWMAAIETGLCMLGYIIGCFLVGWLARFYPDRLLMLIAVCIQFPTVIVFWICKLNLFDVGFLALIIGVTSSSIVLAFNTVKKMVHEDYYGLASGFVNMFFGGTAILLSPVVGSIFQRTHKVNDSLIPIVIFSGIGLIVSILLYRSKIEYLPVREQGGE